jgi:hypothetical protein
MTFDPLDHARASLVGAEKHERSDQARGGWWRKASNTAVAVRREFNMMARELVAIAALLDKEHERDEPPGEDKP